MSIGLIAGLAAPPEAVSNPPGFVLEWGNFGSSTGQFHIPRGIAVGPGGIVIVADERNNRVQEFTTAGLFLRTWGTTSGAIDGFLTPEGVACDAQGFVFVVQSGSPRVQKYQLDGTFLSAWGPGLGSPADVAVSNTGIVYVVDTLKRRVQALRAEDGTPLAIFGSVGSGGGQFDHPWGIGAALDGSVYVADPASNRVQKFTADGVYLSSIGSPGQGPGQFDGPEDVAVDATGRIFVTDFGNHRVQAFDSAGNYLFQWGSYGMGPGEFRYPWGIAIGPDGDIYVTDTGNHRVQRFGLEVVVQKSTWSSIKALYAGR